MGNKRAGPSTRLLPLSDPARCALVHSKRSNGPAPSLPNVPTGPQPLLGCEVHKFSKLPHPDHAGQHYCSACFLWLTPVPHEGYYRERLATASYAHMQDCPHCFTAGHFGVPQWRCDEELAREL